MKRATSIDIHVGRKLKLRRINLGLSQQELGKLLSISFQQIQKYEKSINRISAGRLYEISKVLNIPITYFFDDIDDKSSDFNKNYKAIDYNNLNKEILAISRILCTIKNKEKRKNFINVIKSLIKFMK